MPTETISFKETGYFSPLVCDYIEESEILKDFYNNFPKLKNFKNQIDAKRASFNQQSRHILVESLKKQY